VTAAASDASGAQDGASVARRILVTGGAGAMGRHACAVVADAPDMSLLVADRNEARAAELAASLGGDATTLALDITDAGALRSALAGVDVVLNTVGPFFRYGRPVLEAAIEQGVHYLDITDDWEPTLDMLELHEAARSAGTTAIVGIGASPGISNMLAAAALQEVDKADRVLTGWRAGAGMPRPEELDPQATAAGEHWVHQCSTPIKVWRDGGYADGWALESLEIEYPGRGGGTVWTCGHPESVTIPRSRPEARECLNVMVSRPGLISAMERVVARLRDGELDLRDAVVALVNEPDIRGPAAGEPAPFPDLFALVEGRRDGRPIRVGVSALAIPVGDMGEMTGIPLALAGLMVARGEITERGVFPPEEAIEPQAFFERLAAFAPTPPVDGRLLAIDRTAG
jgi:saccharopine dehydrogenase-like NADP-dependent oxidoreductase